jgi:hypothetical protein
VVARCVSRGSKLAKSYANVQGETQPLRVDLSLGILGPPSLGFDRQTEAGFMVSDAAAQRSAAYPTVMHNW